MDPNSQHQEWSEWAFTVVLPTETPRPYGEVKKNVARFMRKLFGQAARMRLRQESELDVLTRRTHTVWRFVIQAENANANDPDKRVYVEDVVRHFMRNGFGPHILTMDVKLLAGKREDGEPAEQWIFLPPALHFPNIVGGVPSI